MNVKTILSPGKYFLIGFILIASSFVLPVYFNRTTIEDRKPLSFNSIAADNISDCHARRFSLSKGQSCSVEISDRYENVTAITIMFLTYEEYTLRVIEDRDPDDVVIVRQQFIWRYLEYPQGVGDSDNSNRYTLGVIDVVYLIDFIGGGSGSNLVSIPGDYVVVVWGTTSFGTTVKTNLKIVVDGLGDTLRNVFFTMGWIVLLAACVITVVYIIYNKKNR